MEMVFKYTGVVKSNDEIELKSKMEGGMGGMGGPGGGGGAPERPPLIAKRQK